MNNLVNVGRNTWIDHACGAGSSLWFRGDPPFASEKSHMFFVLGKANDDVFVMVNATSQVKSSLQHLEYACKPFGCSADEVSVLLNSGSYPFITKDTLISCRDPHMVTREDLKNGREFDLLGSPPEFSFFVPLLQAWQRSPWLQPEVFENVRQQWAKLGVEL